MSITQETTGIQADVIDVDAEINDAFSDTPLPFSEQERAPGEKPASEPAPAGTDAETGTARVPASESPKAPAPTAPSAESELTELRAEIERARGRQAAADKRAAEMERRARWAETQAETREQAFREFLEQRAQLSPDEVNRETRFIRDVGNERFQTAQQAAEAHAAEAAAQQAAAEAIAQARQRDDTMRAEAFLAGKVADAANEAIKRGVTGVDIKQMYLDRLNAPENQELIRLTWQPGITPDMAQMLTDRVYANAHATLFADLDALKKAAQTPAPAREPRPTILGPSRGSTQPLPEPDLDYTTDFIDWAAENPLPRR